LPSNTPVSINDDEAVVVLGVNPDFKVSFKNGTTEDSGWSIDNYSLSATSNFPTNGYVVVKVPSRTKAETYGLAQVQVKGSIVGYLPCRGNLVITFEAPPGRVSYIGDMFYEKISSEYDPSITKKIKYTYSSNPDKAKRFLTENYPQLAPRMEVQEGKELPVIKSECDLGHYIYAGGMLIRLPGQQRNPDDSLRSYIIP
jgi:hypothetical protein